MNLPVVPVYNMGAIFLIDIQLNLMEDMIVTDTRFWL